MAILNTDLLSPEQAIEATVAAYNSKAAIDKINGLEASASQIDGSVNNKFNFIIGDNLYDLAMEKDLLNLDGFSGTLSNGLVIFENSTENTKFSRETLKFGNNTAGVVSTYTDQTKTLSNTLDMSNIDVVTCWVFVPEGNFVGNSYVSSDYGIVRFLLKDSLGNYSGFRFADSLTIGLQSGWNNITIPKTKFNINSSTAVDWTSIVSVQMQLKTGIGNIGVPIYIDSIIVGSQPLEKTPICITLDDGTTDGYEMVKIMNKYGIPVSTFVTPDYIDSSTATGYLNIEHLDELYKNGNHIGIHGTGASAFASNPNLILEARDWLISKGFTRDDGHLYGTYPNGGYSNATIQLLKDNNFKGFRQVTGVRRNDEYLTEATKSGLPFEMILNGGIAEKFKISSDRPSSYTTFVSNIEKAIEYKSAYIPYHHLFSEVGGRAQWELMAKYLKTKIDEGTIECLTFPQFCKKYSN